jgi:hypothetical protein
MFGMDAIVRDLAHALAERKMKLRRAVLAVRQGPRNVSRPR